MKNRIAAVVLLITLLGAAAWWFILKPDDLPASLIRGNGRIEATEIDLATRIPGRVREILVNEGDFVEQGQILARIHAESLEALLSEAEAQHRQAVSAVATAKAQVTARESDKIAAHATVAQRESELAAANQRLARSENLSADGAVSVQILDDDRAKATSAGAAVRAAEAQVAAADAAIQAAKAQVTGAESTVEAALATISRIKSDLEDCSLRAPRSGRVQYRIAQAGEVLGAGGKVLNLVDLADVYMTFFLPETVVGRVPIEKEVRIVLDAAPDYVIPAKVSYISSVSQFTPKTVETESERQKLMFRIKARVDPDLLQKHLTQVKTGLPGVAWLNLDPETPWPAGLSVKVPELIDSREKK